MPLPIAHAPQLLENDTVAAIATPIGRGGIGVVRLSGPAAQTIAEQILSLRNPLQPGRVRYGLLLDETGRRIDDAIVTLYRAPHSYTGEDVVEIATHGAPVVLEWVIAQTSRAGARLARPGEFTERAFLRGRLDLTQAEAVRDLIDAQTLAQARLAAEQMGGSLAREVRPLKQQLVHLIAALEAGIDFAEDDLETLPYPEIAASVTRMLPPLQALLRSFAHGRLLREGIRLAIVGKPNAGKSSLFNRLLARDRAIVTPVAGTTRDIVSERLVLDGIPIELLDTAGLRETDDEVERIGVARSYEAIADADLIILVIDCTAEPDTPLNGPLAPDTLLSGPVVQQITKVQAAAHRRPLLVVYNKVDLLHGRRPPVAQPGSEHREPQSLDSAQHPGEQTPEHVFASAVTGEGMDDLQSAILRLSSGDAAVQKDTAMLSNLRQHDSIARCLAALSEANVATQTQTPHEMLLLNLYEALQSLNELTGETTPDDILNLIFSTFCIGK